MNLKLRYQELRRKLASAAMNIELHCFTCKKRTPFNIGPDNVEETANKRYVVKSNCSVCDRKITSLVPKKVWSDLHEVSSPNFLSSEETITIDQKENDRRQESDHVL